MPSDPNDDPVKHHVRGHFPYLNVDLGQVSVHAQEMAWRQQRVLIAFPLKVEDHWHYSQIQFSWVDREQTHRIRREDSIWYNPEDDIDWHEIEDGSLAD